MSPSTTWRIVSTPQLRRGLDVTLHVDTTASAVTHAIEEAARKAGITLERVEPDGPRASSPLPPVMWP